ncbi:MAG: hypothetical protein PHC61_03945 [Chitinivibrionales bacterium]|nr:hypothetical protein [Chitinivibrionales bacterium]
MDLDVFENGEKIWVLSNARVDIDRGAATVRGIWMGILPFASASEQAIALELRGPNILITNAWISNGFGGPIDSSIEIKGISKS